MNSQQDVERRGVADRRREPTSPWGVFRPDGRRTRARRADEHRRAYYVDRFSALMLAMIVALLVACIVDAAITICLVDAGHAEVNPLMGLLLARGVLPFFLGKYLLTAVGVVVLLVFKNHYLFGTPIRVGYVIPVLLGVYCILLAYQWHLLVRLGAGAA